MDPLDTVRQWWDDDAEVYDQGKGHGGGGPAEDAAWTAALLRTLPRAPSRVLDCGAGTGFLSLRAAALGHQVTALDLSPAMLAKLHSAATDRGLDVTTVTAPAHQPPDGPFDVVMERHLLWTLPDPGEALTAWRAAAPGGRLVLFEGLWGDADAAQALRRRGRDIVRRLKREPLGHHDSYPLGLRASLPMGGGTHPDALVQAVLASGWADPSLTRLADVEWARLLAMAPPERILGTTIAYTVEAR